MQQENLYYWHRESANSNAEIDYVIQQGEQIVPLEVKASNKGAMQSMFMFLKEKKRDLGIRLSLENFSTYPPVDVYPLYAIFSMLGLTGFFSCRLFRWSTLPSNNLL